MKVINSSFCDKHNLISQWFSSQKKGIYHSCHKPMQTLQVSCITVFQAVTQNPGPLFDVALLSHRSAQSPPMDLLYTMGQEAKTVHGVSHGSIYGQSWKRPEAYLMAREAGKCDLPLHRKEMALVSYH